MDETELLKLAADNLKDTANELIAIAGDPKHFNKDSRECVATLEQFRNQFLLCFTLKNAIAELKRK